MHVFHYKHCNNKGWTLAGVCSGRNRIWLCVTMGNPCNHVKYFTIKAWTNIKTDNSASAGFRSNKTLSFASCFISLLPMHLCYFFRIGFAGMLQYLISISYNIISFTYLTRTFSSNFLFNALYTFYKLKDSAYTIVLYLCN